MYPVSIKGVLFTPDAQVVLLMNERGEWELPGGRLESGETPVACLSREIGEELSLKVTVGVPLDSHVFQPVPGKSVFIVTYLCQLDGPFAPVLSEEHQRWAVFAPAALPAELPDAYRTSIARSLCRIRR